MSSKYEDPLVRCSLVTPQTSEEVKNFKNIKKNTTTYECVSCLDDVLFPPKRKLLHAELRKLNTLAIVLCALTLLVAVSLTTISYSTYSDSKSCSIFAFAFDALLQAISSLMLIWRFSTLSTANVERRETMTTLGVAFVNAVSAISIIVPTVGFVIRKEIATHARISVMVSAIGTILYAALFYAKYKLSRKLGSSALMTDTIDSLGGALLGLSVLVSSLLLLFTDKLWFLDAIIALSIATLMLLYAVVVIVRQVILCRTPETEELQ